jgi:hypothetical protein
VKWRAALGLLAAAGAWPSAPASAQSWRLRFDASAQRVSFRGITPDSITEAQVQTGPDGGPVSPDGFAVNCYGDGFCRFYRAGRVRRGIPASAMTDLTLWGLGVTGLSVRVSARTLTDLTGDRLWPGTAPAFRLLEGYAEYVRGGLTARAGRMLEQSRLGNAGTGGLDGARATWRFDRSGLEIGAYGGWGLARGTTLPVTSPAVNPLADFQPGHHQVVGGALAGLHLRALDALAEYRIEGDPFTDYVVSERASLSLQARPAAPVRAVLGADYDLAQGHWGTADASLSWNGSRAWATLAGRHYQPFFDLWTVWGVFSPVPYNGVNGSLAVMPVREVRLRARGEWYRYEDAGVSVPEVTLEDRGWRWAVEAAVTASPRWTLQAAGHEEFGPGAASRGLEGGVTWRPRDGLDFSVQGGSLERPLELRFQDAGVTWTGVSGDYRIAERWRFGLSLDRYWDSRDRPDAAAFDWNQWRMSARISLALRSGADRWVLPPARPAGRAP